jgi:hypothetical protein
MRQVQAVAVALIIGGMWGCLSPKPEPSVSLFDPQQPFAGPAGEDLVVMDVAVIERPYGDAYLNHELWTDVNEQAVGFEEKVVLEANGFRIGQVGGLLPPGKLQDLLLSRRSCHANRIQLHAGHYTPTPLGGAQAHCRYRIRRDGQEVVMDLPNAQAVLDVTPTLAGENQTQLQFTPRLKYGEVKSIVHALQDPAGPLRWERLEQQEEEVYPWLKWSVTVATGEYVVIGTDVDKVDTLGQRFFESSDEGPNTIPVQRLLVLRATHAPQPASPAGEQASRSVPLALRASWSAVRGRSP